MTTSAARCFLAFALLTLPGGCGVKQAKTSTLLISDGCVVYVEGMSATQAKDITSTLDISDDCEVVAGARTK